MLSNFAGCSVWMWPVTFGEEHKLLMFEKNVLEKKFSPTKDEVSSL
jgi:hypothetical protein